jgi:hypothetical protein
MAKKKVSEKIINDPLYGEVKPGDGKGKPGGKVSPQKKRSMQDSIENLVSKSKKGNAPNKKEEEKIAKPSPPAPRKSWDAPDKTVYEKPAGKAGPLPRSPESIGLPKIPKAPSVGSTLPPSREGALEYPVKRPNLPPIPKPAAKPLVPPPPAAVAGSANVVPQADPLAKFRPSSAGAMTGGPGAAAWDNSWEPSTPMYHQDAMEAEYEPRRAQNMERGDWLAGQSTDQLRQNLSLMSRKQDRPELRNIDAIEWFKKLQQGQR